MKSVIRFDRVGKRYNLQRGGPKSFKEIFVGRRTFNVEDRRERGMLWAVRDVSFEIEPGETVGLIGPNGAGKSTTLKLISRVIPPNTGRVAVDGRVAALLELGTGFHPDLSGRDNIFLSGALIGMGRREMKRKFPDIVEFSELERFIDVPVKYYSSGMFARLAFAVSIHLEPEILLVDEVLAVGDQNFQAKCMDRIRELQAQGITICLVTHALDNVRSLCTRALWFDEGRLLGDGPADEVVSQYLAAAAQKDMERRGETHGESAAGRWGTKKIEIVNVRLSDDRGNEDDVFETSQPLRIHMDYRTHVPVPSPVFGLAIHRQDGLHVCGPNTGFAGLELPALDGEGTVTYRIPDTPLLEGLYNLTVAVHSRDDSEMYDYHDRLYPFRVINNFRATRERYGVVTLGGAWSHELADHSGAEATRAGAAAADR